MSNQIEYDAFWEGFDVCLAMVVNRLNNSDPHIWTDLFKSQIIHEAELFKKED